MYPSLNVATYDPGWNDPPPMPSSGVPQPSAPGKSRISLNKRVAFPMQSSGASSTSNVKTTAEGLPLPFSTAKYQPPSVSTEPLPAATQPALPPPPATIFNPSAPPQAVPTELESNEDFDSATAKDLTHSVFTRLVDAMTSHTDAGKLSEIRKRLETLDQMWQENKLNESAQKNLYELAKGKTFVGLLGFQSNEIVLFDFLWKQLSKEKKQQPQWNSTAF